LFITAKFGTIESAIMEEKRLKGGSRKQKDDLIATMNPGYADLWEQIY
jgi:putative endonuclease